MISLRKTITYPNVTATLALLVSLSTAGWAATALPANSVGSKQIKNGSVQQADLGRGSVGQIRYPDTQGLAQTGELSLGPGQFFSVAAVQQTTRGPGPLLIFGTVEAQNPTDDRVKVLFRVLLNGAVQHPTFEATVEPHADTVVPILVRSDEIPAGTHNISIEGTIDKGFATALNGSVSAISFESISIP